METLKLIAICFGWAFSGLFVFLVVFLLKVALEFLRNKD